MQDAGMSNVKQPLDNGSEIDKLLLRTNSSMFKKEANLNIGKFFNGGLAAKIDSASVNSGCDVSNNKQ
jgi:hypothetical protein